MNIAIYSRKSVVTGRGESIETQIKLCRQYISAHIPDRAPCLHIYRDEGYSAKNTQRPQFLQMLNDLRTNSFDYLICYKLDRISRNVSDFSDLLEELNQRNIALVCIKEKFDTSTPMGKAMMYIASVFAQLERETIAERVKDNMYMLARSGRWLGGIAPTGYIATQTENQTGSLALEPQEALLVRTIFQAFLQSRSLTAVAKQVNAQYFKTRTGRPFSLTTVKQILQNPVYCIADQNAYRYFSAAQANVCFTPSACSKTHGLLVYNKRDYKNNAKRLPKSKWIVAIGRHPGIVSGADWVKVQQYLLQNSKTRSHTKNQYALLSGKITCGLCGSPMLAKSRSNHAFLYDYICKTKLNGGSCACKNINGPAVDHAVLLAMAQHLPLANWQNTLQKMHRIAKKENIFFRQKQVALKENAVQTEQILTAIATGHWNPEVLQILNQKLLQLQQQKQALCTEVSEKQNVTPEQYSTLLQAPQIFLNNLTLNQKREWAALTIDALTLVNDTLHLSLKTPK